MGTFCDLKYVVFSLCRILARLERNASTREFSYQFLGFCNLLGWFASSRSLCVAPISTKAETCAIAFASVCY